MTRVRLIFIFYFFLLLSENLISQDFLPYLSTYRLYRIRYVSGNSHPDTYGNEIIWELAKDYLKPPGNILINLGFRETISLKRNFVQGYLVKLALAEFFLSGDLSYRGFLLKNFLMPSGLSFSFCISNKNDPGNFYLKELERSGLKTRDTVVFLINAISADTAFDTLSLRNIRFSFSPEDRSRFYERKTLIDDYYASAALIENLYRESLGWDMTLKGSLPSNYFRLTELVRILELVRMRDFSGLLLQDNPDIRNLIPAYHELYKVSRTHYYNFLETLARTSEISIKTPPDSLCDEMISGLMRYVRLNSLMDQIHGKIYSDYLLKSYSIKVFDNEPEVVRSILCLMYPGAGKDTLMSWASNRLLKAYCRKASALIDSGKYSDAFMLMENSREMASGNTFLKEKNGWEELYTRSVNGIYNSFCGIASTSFDAGNTRMATEYLSKAEEYRRRFPERITSDSVYRRVYRSVFLGRLDLCSQMLQEKEYYSALSCLEDFETAYSGRSLELVLSEIIEKKAVAWNGIARELLRKSTDFIKEDEPDSVLKFYDQAAKIIGGIPARQRNVRVFDSLAPAVALIRYSKANSLGIYYYQRRQFARSLGQFKQAAELSESYSLPKDPLTDSVCKQAWKQWLLDKLSGQQQLIWNNKPDSAKTFLSKSLEAAAKKGLGQDSDILKAAENFRRQMQDQFCGLIEDSINILTVRAGRCFALKKFHRGCDILDHASFMAGNNPECHIGLGMVRDSLSRYRVAADYQQKLEDAETFITSGDVERGLKLLAAGEAEYSSARIDNFGLPLVSVYDFVLLKNNPYLSIRTLEFYLGNNNPDEAFRYLRLLRLQGMPSGSSLPYQEKLARELAVRDRQAFPATDPQTMVRKYTSSDSWLNRFGNTYLLEWNRLLRGQ